MAFAREQFNTEIAEVKVQFGLVDLPDDLVAVALHISNQFGIEVAAALDQVARSASEPMAGWAFDRADRTLHIFQGSLSQSVSAVLGKAGQLLDAAELVADLTLDDLGESFVSPSINNLRALAPGIRDQGQTIRMTILTLLPEREVKGASAFSYLEKDLRKSRLFRKAQDAGGHLQFAPSPFRTTREEIPQPRFYLLEASAEAGLSASERPEVRIMFVSLKSLVQLLRRRGPLVFEKNVRMYLGSRGKKTNLEHPMTSTLEAITRGHLTAATFLAYHGGVTITAADAIHAHNGIQLDAPSIVNGCQTVSIADRYLEKLEKSKDAAMIERFASIMVLAKVIVRPSDDELREIANSNNRQNPIEPWQLFCNDPVHVRIELLLQNAGVFYERQLGKFASIPAQRRALTYPNTNKTFISPMELARVVALCRGDLPLAAKPSDVFVSKDVHDSVFDTRVLRSAADIVWAINCFKAVSRGVRNYFHNNLVHRESEDSNQFLTKPLARAGIHYVSMLWLAQRSFELSQDYAFKLNKVAPLKLNQSVEQFLRQVVARMKAWYVEESESFTREVSATKISKFIDELLPQLKLSRDGICPLTDNSPMWEQLEQSA